MLSDPKSTFRYRPSYDTDIRRTFARLAREQKKAEEAKRQPAPTPTPQAEDQHVVPMRKRSAR